MKQLPNLMTFQHSFLGRPDDLGFLSQKFDLGKSQIGVVYGRRRVGKSELIKHFCNKKRHLMFEGLEDEPTKIQIQNFVELLRIQLENDLSESERPKNWTEVFQLLTRILKAKSSDEPFILFLDEFPWMSCLRTSLVSLLKLFWDNEWKNLNVILILCGSTSSFMVNHIINSKALYGRISWEMNLQKLPPNEASLFFKRKRSEEEILLYLMLFGGIPKYLEEINLQRSFQNNIETLCYHPGGFFLNEFDKIFYSHFKDHHNYKKISQLLAEKNYDLESLAKKLKWPSGGGLKTYLSNLESAGFIRSYTPIIRSKPTNIIKYKLVDEYCRFYFKYIKPYRKNIEQNASQNVFTKKIIQSWKPWLGIAFENFCIQNAMYLAKKMGFSAEVESFGPHFERSDDSFQIDLLYNRFDKVIVLCEIKYHNTELKSEIIAEVERKAKLIKVPKGYTLEKAIISPHGVDKVTKNSGYFNYICSPL